MLETSSSGAQAYGKAWHLMSGLKLRPPLRNGIFQHPAQVRRYAGKNIRLIAGEWLRLAKCSPFWEGFTTRPDGRGGELEESSCPVTAVVSMGRRNTQLEPTLH